MMFWLRFGRVQDENCQQQTALSRKFSLPVIPDGPLIPHRRFPTACYAFENGTT
jgi:hypothetical protein